MNFFGNLLGRAGHAARALLGAPAQLALPASPAAAAAAADPAQQPPPPDGRARRADRPLLRERADRSRSPLERRRREEEEMEDEEMSQSKLIDGEQIREARLSPPGPGSTRRSLHSVQWYEWLYDGAVLSTGVAPIIFFPVQLQNMQQHEKADGIDDEERAVREAEMQEAALPDDEEEEWGDERGGMEDEEEEGVEEEEAMNMEMREGDDDEDDVNVEGDGDEEDVAMEEEEEEEEEGEAAVDDAAAAVVVGAAAAAMPAAQPVVAAAHAAPAAVPAIAAPTGRVLRKRVQPAAPVQQLQHAQQVQRRRATRRPTRTPTLHVKRVARISSMRSSLAAQPRLALVPPRVRATVQSDETVGVTTRDVIALNKLKQKRSLIVSHCEARVARSEIIGSPYSMVATATRGMGKLAKFDEAMAIASVGLHDLVKAANARGAAVLVGRREKKTMKRVREALKEAKKNASRWRDIW